MQGQLILTHPAFWTNLVSVWLTEPVRHSPDGRLVHLSVSGQYSRSVDMSVDMVNFLTAFFGAPHGTVTIIATSAPVTFHPLASVQPPSMMTSLHSWWAIIFEISRIHAQCCSAEPYEQARLMDAICAVRRNYSSMAIWTPSASSAGATKDPPYIQFLI